MQQRSITGLNSASNWVIITPEMGDKKSNINENFLNAISEFNFYRDPECRARIVKVDEENLEVEFTGTVASYACCFDENFVDLKFYFLDFANEDVDIREVLREDRDKFIVTYRRKEKKGG